MDIFKCMSVSTTSGPLRIMCVFAFLYMNRTFLFLQCLLLTIVENWPFQKYIIATLDTDFPFPAPELLVSVHLFV